MESKNIKYEDLYKNAYPYNYITAGYGIVISGAAIILAVSLLITIMKKKEKSKVDMQLCILLLWVDLGCAIIALINAIANIAHYKYYLGSDMNCNLIGALVNILFSTAVFLMAVTSLERFLIIVLKKEYSLKFYFCILAIFSLINTANIIQTVVNSGYKMYPLVIYCQYNTSQTAGLAGSVVMVLVGGVSYTMIVICYLTICVYRRSQSIKAQTELGLDPVKVKKEVNSTISKSLLIMFTSIFATGIFVVMTVITWFSPDILTPKVDMVQKVFVQSQMILNTLILLNMRPDLWRELVALYGFKPK
ncbi:hypothetical protein CONCODRAFT_10914 [Conidiobolus coronatus NRRL 28638]|uniref:G-protein coupled receptors family 1 profile domain-containing protein n=1 Tax=Conidiobolus coronatus (strain ATCC 28846 / CBS 209.66 / NRRL 28638) TaxID=796925 RepID=A0A137NWT3_CONC2|nr:hypothetical protein CONCODRAFT_10914 [Conidiobolus coronatus NRRL 28638]|eukprot:KXN67094.1 hypothetical protein CONCODRAFT_10914 [Conidiobolus coronatus NRRL 28638]